MDITPNSAYVELLTQRYEQLRHLDNLRMHFTTFYAVVVAGALAFLAQATGNSSRPLLVALDVLSLLGLLISLRIGSGVTLMLGVLDQLADTLQVQRNLVSVSSEDCTKYIRMRYLFPLIYIGGIVIFTWFSVLGKLP